MAYGIGYPADGVDDQGWKLYITSLIMVIAAGLFVIARCAVRFSNKQSGADDYTIVASLAFSIVLSVAINLAVVNGYGRHKADLTKQQLSLALKWFFIAQTPYKVTVCLYKISGLLFYKRIFVPKPFQIACWVALCIVVSWGVAVIFATIFQCIPIQGAWDTTIPANCINTDAFWVAFAVSNTLTDVMVLSLPIPSILRLHLHLRERVLLLGVFLLGGFVVICGILRTTSVANSLNNKQDITYNFIPRGIWTLVEANVGIICACLPLLKSPFTRILSKVFGMRGTTKDASARSAEGSDPRKRSDHGRFHGGSKRGSSSFPFNNQRLHINRQVSIEMKEHDEESILGKHSRHELGEWSTEDMGNPGVHEHAGRVNGFKS